MENSEKLIKEIQFVKKSIWLFFLLVWIARLWQGLLLHQLHEAPFVSVAADNFYWLWHGLGFVSFSIQNYWLGLGLDLSWLGVAILGLLQKEKKWQIVLFWFIFLNYFIVYNSVATHHEHTLVPLLFLQLLLIIKNTKNFTLFFVAARYYALFTILSAALWKIGRGSIWTAGQMKEILKLQHFDYLTSYPESNYSHFIYYIINHAYLADLLWLAGWGLELLFMVGFFTRKFDKWLAGLFFAFFAMDYLIMNICFAEFCIFAIVFYPFPHIWKNYYQLEEKKC